MTTDGAIVPGAMTSCFGFGHGFGDCINEIYRKGTYQSLSTLTRRAEATVLLHTADNPFLPELFEHHPNRPFFDLIECEYSRWPKSRIQVVPHLQHIKPVFYASPEQNDLLARIQRSPYIVACLEAREPRRDVPPAVTAAVLRALRHAGFRILGIGRSYHPGFERPGVRFDEYPFVEDYYDRLSLPATVKLIQGAAGVISAFTATKLIAWHEQKPLLLLFPQYIADHFNFPVPYRDTSDPDYHMERFSFGRHNPTTVMVNTDHYAPSEVLRFIEILKGAR